MVTVEEFDSVPQAQSQGFNFRPFLRIAKRNAFLILGIAGVVTGFGVWYSSKDYTPIYQGAFQLLVEPATQEEQQSEPSALTRNSHSSGLDYSTQLRILQSPKMLEQILAELRPQYPRLTEDKLRSGLSIGRVGSGRDDTSKIVEVRYEAAKPQLIVDILEVTAEEYLQYSLEERKTNITEGVEFINEQLPGLQQEVDTLSSQIQALRQEYRLLSPDVQGEQLYEEAREITNEQMELQRQVQELRSRYINLQNQLNVTPQQALDELLLRQNPAYQNLLNQIKQIDIELAAESSRFQAGSPSIQFLQEKQQNLQRLLNQETQRILGRTLSQDRIQSIVAIDQSSTRTDLLQQFVNVSQDLQALQLRNSLLTRDRQVFEQQVQQFPAIERQNAELTRQLSIATKTLDELLLKRQILQVEAAQEQFPWEILAEPELRQRPNGELVVINQTDIAKSARKFFAIGLALGYALAFLIEKGRNIFHSTADVKDIVNAPLLAEIPRYKPLASGGNQDKTNTLAGLLHGNDLDPKSLSPFNRAFEGLQTKLRLLMAEESLRTLAVCAAEPQSGNSTVALHLAQAVALSGQRVLLVDANFHTPQLHLAFNLPNQRGFSDLVTNTSISVQEVIHQPQLVDNLWILTAGTKLSTRLLSSTNMPKVMDRLAGSTNFDLVIYDIPSLTTVENSSFMAAHTDAILLVAGVRATKSSAFKNAVKQLEEYDLPIIGVVANHVQKSQNVPLSIEELENSIAADNEDINEEFPRQNLDSRV